jgi:hypothetical protein
VTARRNEGIPMNLASVDIEEISIARIASIFSIPADKIEKGWRFGHELSSSFSSDFRRNELDRINDDIHDVADKETLRSFASGVLTISTVADYCELMVRRSKVDLKSVLDVLKTA